MDAPEQRVRFLILSDTHCALPRPSTSTDVFRWPLPEADVLIHAGDLTMNGAQEQHEKALSLIKGIDAELKIVIPGNHDLTLDREYYDRFWNLHGPSTKYSPERLDQTQAMYTDDDAKRSGIVYLTEGIRTFTLKNGSTFTVYASAWQPEFYNWAFGYPREQDRYNMAASESAWQPSCPVPDTGIDVMITHGPPAGILDETYRGERVGCEHLRRAVERCKPRLHAFGHIHEGWGAQLRSWSQSIHDDEEVPESDHTQLVQRMGNYHDGTDLIAGKQTLFVNASIMNLRYRPSQTPWIVDLKLPSTRGSDPAT